MLPYMKKLPTTDRVLVNMVSCTTDMRYHFALKHLKEAHMSGQLSEVVCLQKDRISAGSTQDPGRIHFIYCTMLKLAKIPVPYSEGQRNYTVIIKG